MRSQFGNVDYEPQSNDRYEQHFAKQARIGETASYAEEDHGLDDSAQSKGAAVQEEYEGL